MCYRLEGFVDADGLLMVLDALAEVCRAKEEHLQANWQDGVSAKTWAKLGAILDRAYQQAEKAGAS